MNTTPKERPILYSAPMVRARNAGTKRMTRRIMKVQPPSAAHMMSLCVSSTNKKAEGRNRWVIPDGSHGSEWFTCPYGQPGERLWGRETYALLTDPGALTTWDLQIPSALPSELNPQLGHIPTPIFRADGERPDVTPGKGWGRMRWRPGIHMPRWASRMLDEVVSVKVERVQDISEEDAQAEGCGIFIPDHATPQAAWDLMNAGRPWAASFCVPWCQINGAESWAANPHCWVIEFRKVS